MYPKVGEPHYAVFEIAEPVVSDGSVPLALTLDFQFGSQHQLGKFRVSVTNATDPHGKNNRPVSDSSDVLLIRVEGGDTTVRPIGPELLPWIGRTINLSRRPAPPQEESPK